MADTVETAFSVPAQCKDVGRDPEAPYPPLVGQYLSLLQDSRAAFQTLNEDTKYPIRMYSINGENQLLADYWKETGQPEKLIGLSVGDQRDSMTSTNSVQGDANSRSYSSWFTENARVEAFFDYKTRKMIDQTIYPHEGQPAARFKFGPDGDIVACFGDNGTGHPNNLVWEKK